jgi:hypothetical protein
MYEMVRATAVANRKYQWMIAQPDMLDWMLGTVSILPEKK